MKLTVNYSNCPELKFILVHLIMAFCRTMLTAEHPTQGSPVWIVLSTTLGQFFYQSIPNVIEQKEETRVTALLIFNISFTWLNLVRFQIPFVRFQLSQIQFCGRWQNAWNEWYYNSAITGQFIRRKRCQSTNAETDVYLFRWSTDVNIDR